jgi:hypothetical protein
MEMSTFKTAVLAGAFALSIILVSTGFAAGGNNNAWVATDVAAPKKPVSLPASSTYPFGETTYTSPTYYNSPSTLVVLPSSTIITTTVPIYNGTILFSYAPVNALGYTILGQFLGNNPNYSIPWYNTSPNIGASLQGNLGNRVPR